MTVRLYPEPGGRRPRTMDNPYTTWSPLPARPRLEWPGGAQVALCVVVSLERLEWHPPADALPPPSATLLGPYPRTFSIQEVTWLEYGNRVGVFRVMDILDRLGLRATAAIDARLAADNPFLVRECLRRDWEVIGHGLAFSRVHSERMTESDERDHIRQALGLLEQAVGRPAEGWLGPEYGESSRTVRLLAEAGVRYVCDWPNDEQPYRMTVPVGEMVGLPVNLDLDEVFTHKVRGVPIQRWADNVVEAFDRLHADGATTGRLLVLNLHPYLIGQPWRSRYLERALEHVVERGGVWCATGREVVDWYLGRSAQPERPRVAP